jgi:hypothetical protein
MIGRRKGVYAPRRPGPDIDWPREMAAAGAARAEIARVDEQARAARTAAMVNPLGLSADQLDPVLTRRVGVVEQQLTAIFQILGSGDR